MGHREALLAAARTCLEERGYARTTARDLVAASGTNLASIGYHFGSKEALLNEAIEAAFVEYTEKVLALAASAADDRAPSERVRAGWVATAEQFSTYRPLLVAFVEALAQAERNTELRLQLAASYARLRGTVAATVIASAPELPAVTATTVASAMIAVCDGLMLQWLLDPEATPSAGGLFDALHLALCGA